MSFHRKDLQQDALEILEFEVPGFDATRHAALVQRITDLLSRAYYEGYTEADSNWNWMEQV